MAVIVYPFILTNGTVADANEVMADFNAVTAQANGNLGPTNIDLTASYAWTGNHTFSQDLVWYSGTAFTGTLEHSNTANRVYTFPDTSGTVLLSSGGGGGSTTINNTTLTGNTTVNGPATFNNTVTFSTMTPGSIFFAGLGGLLSQDNANFFWDDTNNRLGIGTSTPTGSNVLLHINKSSNAGLRITTDAGSNSFIQFGIVNGAALLWDGSDSSIVMNYDVPLGTGNNQICKWLNTGEMRLPSIDPPTANYANRNSFIKGWVRYDRGTSTINGDYNIASITNGAAGLCNINWDTNFSGNNYVMAAMGLANIFVSQQNAFYDGGSVGIQIQDDAGVLTSTEMQVIAIGGQ